MVLTSLMILINIQLFVLAVKILNNSGARGRYTSGFFLASSQMRLTVADTTPMSSSARRSRSLSIHGSSPASSLPVPNSVTPGHARTTRHMVNVVCFLMGGREWVSMERSSGARSRAREGVRRSDTAERVERRWATVSDEGEDENMGVGGFSRSYTGRVSRKMLEEWGVTRLLDEVHDEDSHLRLLVEALRRSQVPDTLDMILGAAHTLDNRERSEADRVSQHLELPPLPTSALTPRTHVGRNVRRLA